jgi:LPXTG-site transpeptidase (sortase) family protein
LQVAVATADWGGASDILLPNTGFAPGVITRLPQQPAEKNYTSAGDLEINIPALGIKTTIVGVPKDNNGWDVTWLGNQLGWLQGTTYPTWRGNSVLSGHVYLPNGLPGPFVNLSKLSYGDKVTISTDGLQYIYEVRTVKQVSPTNQSIMKTPKGTWLTLLTCKEYNERTGQYRWRVAVQAVLIAVK